MNFSTYFLRTYILLKEKNCAFNYQRANCKKQGHYKKKVVRATGETTYEIRIEKNENDAGKIYTYTHEMAHFLNNHLDDKSLTYAQREWVAHNVGMYFIKLFNLEKELKK